MLESIVRHSYQRFVQVSENLTKTEVPLVIEAPLAGEVRLMHVPVGVGVAVGIGVGVPATRLTVIEAEPSREPPPLVHERTETEWFPNA